LPSGPVIKIALAVRTKLPLMLAITALAVAVFGSTPIGRAAQQLVVPSRNTVGTPQLKNNAVTSIKVLNGTLRAADFRQSDLPQGPPGPAGPSGPAGPAGPAGAAGISGREAVFGTSFNDSSSFKTATATCPTGKNVIGGGATIAPTGAGVAVALQGSYLNGASGWIASAREIEAYSGSWNLNVVVYCATTP
jgi:hypothetical protein